LYPPKDSAAIKTVCIDLISSPRKRHVIYQPLSQKGLSSHDFERVHVPIALYVLQDSLGDPFLLLSMQPTPVGKFLLQLFRDLPFDILWLAHSFQQAL
jgi:hypothetical protein